MNNLQHILQQLFRKDHLTDISTEQLEVVVREHPLFAPAHFLLAKKYRQTGSELYNEQLQKTTLHFHNPLWLHYQLSENETTGSYQLTTLDTPTAPTFTERIEDSSSHDLIEQVVTSQEMPPDQSPDLVSQVDATEMAGQPIGATDDAHVGEMYNTDADSETLKLAESEAAAHHNTNEAPPINTAVNEVSDEPALSAIHLSKPSHPLFSKREEEDNGDAKPVFEPYHTIDYFASQGIKISQEIKAEDRLGKQMKSFTEWLKTMRKLPEASVEAELEKINDREIVSIAEHSLDENEVVTEAMAEVFFKQGLFDQAAEVYRKLSLLNPSKSSYFAAKIEALKNH